MRRHLALLSLIVGALTSTPLTAQCTPQWNVMQQQTTPDYVHLNVDSSLSSAAASAISMWQGCATGSDMRPKLPYPTTGNPYGSSTATLNVKYYTGFNPNNSSACGRFPGQAGGSDIDIYEKAYDPQGNVVQCSSFGNDFLIAHEMGHFYHLMDTGASCTDIMGQANGSSHSLTTDDCQQAKDVNHTLDEDAPYDYTCMEPCYTNCYMYQCPANHGGSPIVMNLDDSAIKLTGPNDPVFFDIFNTGKAVWTSWTDAEKSDTVFLCDDLNANGEIDNAGELFGNNTRLMSTGRFASNGYEALAEYDWPANGGNGDGKITNEDLLYNRLLVWRDTNHNGRVDRGELNTLRDAGVISISVGYRSDRKRDRFGNEFFYRSDAVVRRHGDEHVVATYDVLFVPSQR